MKKVINLSSKENRAKSNPNYKEKIGTSSTFESENNEKEFKKSNQSGKPLDPSESNEEYENESKKDLNIFENEERKEENVISHIKIIKEIKKLFEK